MINSSWGGYVGSNGSDPYSMMADGFANLNPRTLFVVAAGNTGPGPDQVWSPAAAYNNLSVAALGANPPYDRRSATRRFDDQSLSVSSPGIGVAGCDPSLDPSGKTRLAACRLLSLMLRLANFE